MTKTTITFYSGFIATLFVAFASAEDGSAHAYLRDNVSGDGKMWSKSNRQLEVSEASRNLILNGEIIEEKDDVPKYLVTLGTLANGDDDEAGHTCGGSIISSRAVLTAAHCWDEGKNKVDYVDLKRFNVCDESDEYDRRFLARNSGGKQADAFRVIHPKYPKTQEEQAESANYDYALVIFNDPIPMDYHAAIALNDDTSIPSKNEEELTAFGWGSLGTNANGGAYPAKPRRVVLNHLSDDMCLTAEDENELIYDLDVKIMLCTKTDNKDVCRADSGGPLVIWDTDKNEWTQVGIVSNGPDCFTKANGNDDGPGVFARVSGGLYWIKKTVCEETGEMCQCHAEDPTMKPTTQKPTMKPTTQKPTMKPTTQKPTMKPTSQPTKEQTMEPTGKPSKQPSGHGWSGQWHETADGKSGKQ